MLDDLILDKVRTHEQNPPTPRKVGEADSRLSPNEARFLFRSVLHKRKFKF